MEKERVDQLLTAIEKIQEKGAASALKKLDLDQSKRIVKRLDSFASDCEECEKHFFDFEKHLLQLKELSDSLTAEDIKNHKQKVTNISNHLQKQHNLIPGGHYLGIYLSLGVSLGVVFGLLIFDNIGIGIPIGMGIGVAVGLFLDEDAKKKETVI
jgi:hypothetical protein